MALLGLSNLHAQSATAPTASEDQKSIDQVWQKASGKYDAERTALLQRVDSVDNQGPFRADWESLKKYETPEWYRDAKFGIFDWTAAKMGPHRDVIGELGKAVRAEGLHFGVSSHRGRTARVPRK